MLRAFFVALLTRIFRKKRPEPPQFAITEPIKALPGYFFFLHDPKSDQITRFLGPRHHYGGGMYSFTVPMGCSLIRARNEAGARQMLKNRAKRAVNAEKPGKTTSAA